MDKWSGQERHLFSEADYFDPVSVDGSDLTRGVCRALWCSEEGALKITDKDGNIVDDVPVFAGLNPLRAKAVDEPTTGDAPTSVFALY